ncbi:hypothetical protein WME79_19575 [Sorangium sp. So ce726]
MSESVRVSIAQVWLDESTGIVRVRVDPGTTVTLARKAFALQRSLENRSP